MKKNLPIWIYKVLGLAVILVFSIMTLYPLAQTIFISLKSPAEFAMSPLGFPAAFRFVNYIDAWVKGNLGVLYANTVIVTALTILFVILLASPAGFTLSKLNVKGEKHIYNYFMLGMLIPFQTIMIPLMKFSNLVHGNNKLSTLIVIYVATNLSFPILIYTGFYKNIPFEIIEAARIDGCNIVRLFMQIIFPMTTAVNFTVAIFVGKVPWNDFFIPLVFTNEKKVRTLAIGLFSFQGQYYTDWTLVFAVIVLMSFPLILLYLIAQKSFVSGLTAGAIKG